MADYREPSPSYEQVPQAPAPIAPLPRSTEKFDPNAPLVYLEADQATKNTYGHDVRIHPVTKMPIEQGSGALPEHQQVLNHIAAVEREQGSKAANAMRKKLDINTTEDIAQAQAVVDAANERIEKDRFNAAVDAKVKEILATPPTRTPINVQGSANWSPLVNYTRDQVVIGADGQSYVATSLGGNLDKNPVSDDQRSYWVHHTTAPRAGAANMTAAEVDERMRNQRPENRPMTATEANAPFENPRRFPQEPFNQ
jgi:hypothetical protein